MPFLHEYGLFLAKTATIVISLIILLAVIIALKTKSNSEKKGSLQIKKLNDKFDELTEIICDTTHSKKEKKQQKAKQKKAKKTQKKSDEKKKRVFVIQFDGDIKASAVEELREMITAILLTAQPEDQVLLCLESGGGLVHAYGLAASQLQRLRDANIHLVVAIDKLAASGGYMMACVANQIIAAPFAIIGSIGIITQLPNLHKLLQKHHIDFEQITAGEYKRTLTIFGKNTDAGREKLQEEVNETHDLFKMFVKNHRNAIAIDAVATGEHWFATQCLEKNLVDHLQTSDDYLLSKQHDFDIYELTFKIKKPLVKRFFTAVQNSFYTMNQGY